MVLDKPIRVVVVLGGKSLFGRERSNIQVFNFLREIGYEVLFVVDKCHSSNDLIDYLIANNFSIRQVRMAGLFSKGMSLSVWITKLSHLFIGSVEFLSIVRSFKPTHLHLADSSVFISLLLALAFLRLPVIYRLGDEPLNKPYPYKLVWRYLIKPRVNKFVCISRFISGVLDSIPGKSNSRIIYNYPPERTYDEVSDDNKKILSAERINVSYVGQIHPQKGVMSFVKAATQLSKSYPAVNFVIIGSLNKCCNYSEALLAYIKDNGVLDRFIFTGRVSDVYSALSCSYVHVMPSLVTEALGNVVLEAKVSGIPSVIFPTGGTPELIEHGVDGYVCRDMTVDALVDGIRFFLDSPILTRQAGLSAKASLARLGITKENYVKAWRDVYEVN